MGKLLAAGCSIFGLLAIVGGVLTLILAHDI